MDSSKSMYEIDQERIRELEARVRELEDQLKGERAEVATVAACLHKAEDELTEAIGLLEQHAVALNDAAWPGLSIDTADFLGSVR